MTDESERRIAERVRRDIGYEIRRLRIERQLKSKDLAELAHVSRSTVSKIERGQLNATVATVNDLCDALDADESLQQRLVTYARSLKLATPALPSTGDRLREIERWIEMAEQSYQFRVLTLGVPALLQLPYLTNVFATERTPKLFKRHEHGARHSYGT